jgi:lipoyl-dependent peroxiredoxin
LNGSKSELNTDRIAGFVDFGRTRRTWSCPFIAVKETTMTQTEQERAAETSGKVIYTARTHTTGGREHGWSRSSDGSLDIRLSIPGSTRIGANPEQLLAAGWSACFESAMAIAAVRKKIALPDELAIDAEIDLNLAETGYFLRARLNVSLPGVERKVAQALIDEADRTCPYSKAIRGNVDVAIKLV